MSSSYAQYQNSNPQNILFDGNINKSLPKQVFRANAEGYRLKEYFVDTINGIDFTSLYHFSYNYIGDYSGTFLSQLYPFANGGIDYSEAFYEVYSGTAYIPLNKITRSYDADSNVYEEENDIWLGSYINYQLETFEYDDDKLMIKTKSSWDGTTYQPEFENEYTYTVDLLTYKLESKYVSGVLENDEQYFFNYDGEDRLTSVDVQRWVAGTMWEDKNSYFFYYNADGSIAQVTYQQNDGTGLQDFYRSTYSYAAGFLSEINQESFDGSAWQNFQRYLVYFDENDNLSYFDVELWSGTEWMALLRYTFIYEEFGATLNNDILNDGFTYGPNPASNYLKVNVDHSNNENITAEIYNISGKLVFSSSINNNQFTWDLTGSNHIKVAPGILSIKNYDR